MVGLTYLNLLWLAGQPEEGPYCGETEAPQAIGGGVVNMEAGSSLISEGELVDQVAT